jgi:hypothetical protein
MGSRCQAVPDAKKGTRLGERRTAKLLFGRVKGRLRYCQRIQNRGRRIHRDCAEERGKDRMSAGQDMGTAAKAPVIVKVLDGLSVCRATPAQGYVRASVQHRKRSCRADACCAQIQNHQQKQQPGEFNSSFRHSFSIRQSSSASHILTAGVSRRTSNCQVCILSLTEASKV